MTENVKALTSDWLTWAGLAFEILGKVDWLNFLLVGTGFAIVFMLLIAQFRKGDGFDMRSMFARRDVVDGLESWTVEPGRVFQTTAFLVTTWGFITITVRDKLSEWYLLVYVVLWAGSRALNQIVASRYPVAPGTFLDSAPPVQQPAAVVTTTTEVKTP